ncbi:MAG: calcineurin-like phosphoesterase family protein [Pedobacter sp.]|uniref:calcineurin-like phosphoesterase family protein n=1 Tax=Pedobacter sp. TaxID=1411316 RepID=UPI00280717E5|nr:calcineurin-like phosphoesterase family protein [Pedobacter sp.]MDQ8005541.1 calcineurin-like phosphoesterase family protein [Pedobacter sp.]
MNKRKEKRSRKTITRRDFIVTTTVAGLSLTVFGCKKSEPAAPTPTPPPTGGNKLAITNVNIPNKLNFAIGKDHTFQGEGFAVGDKLIFVSQTDATKSFTVEIKSVTTNSCTFTVPTGFLAASFRISITRGNESATLGSSTIEIAFQNIADVAGMTVKGSVFAGGVGLANVIVSDGVEVTKTDQNGIYYLKSAKNKDFVFVSIPGGYEVENSNGILPAFYKGFTTNANTVENIDFELKAVNNDKHVMLALGDMHLANRNNDVTQFQNGFLTDAAKTITKYKNEGYKVYGLTLGDMTWETYWYDNNYSFSQYLALMKSINIPVFHTMGNHDNDPYINADWQAETAYRASLGPTYYSFNVGKVHYIVLDNVQYINTNGAQGVAGTKNYNGVIVADQIAWLKKDLAMITDKSTPIVIGMHIQLNNAPTLSGQNETATLRLNNSTEFISTLAGFTDVNVITGHTHVCYAYENNANIMEHNSGAICATWWWTGRSGYANNHTCKDGAPGGYAIWKFNNKNYDWKYKSIGFEENYQFRAYDLNKVHITAAKYAPSSTDALLNPYKGPYANANNNNEILVNVWGFDKQWKVEILENGTPLAVTRVSTLDPLHIISYEALRLNVGQTPTADFVTANSAHFFKAKANGATTPIEIRVTDRFGNVYSETMNRPKDLVVSMK